MIIVTYIHNGYVFKVPVLGTDQGDNWWGLGLTISVFALANIVSYLY
jgi:hypothetical protein